jgi:FKBP-type peptidyl-prolyl cis-trans isomerase FklB
MKKNKTVILLTAIIGLASCNLVQPTTATVNASQLKTQNDSVSYVLGVSMAENIKGQGVGKLNDELLNAGVNNTLDGKEPMLTEAERNEVLKTYFNNIKLIKEKEAKAEETAFLATNKKKPNVVELPSGLQYKMLTKGTGTTKPTTTNRVSVHYTGRLIDGTVFDSSVQRGQPATFGVTQVIKGWHYN